MVPLNKTKKQLANILGALERYRKQCCVGHGKECNATQRNAMRCDAMLCYVCCAMQCYEGVNVMMVVVVNNDSNDKNYA